MLRLFVGIDLPPALKLRLSTLCFGVPEARWVDPGNFHVTLRFIGEVDEGLASDIDAALLRLSGPPFQLSLAGVGQFGTRMLWVGVEKSPPLLQLQGKVESALQRAGLPPETRRFTPHVSLARLRPPLGPKVQGFLAANALFRAEPFDVDGFNLVASYLTKSGAIYEDQAEYPLA
ncbi:MAG TPA: RNA 2',3'-cyclic phosphodiesterase [Stellaceae bacterium]|jgi:2'-5' RNA ligase|nr:RNA 2',3'-cyclic phosphodiesterase [Stellaceae bacterium]